MPAPSPAPVPPEHGPHWTACTDAPLDAGRAAAWVAVPSCGAVVTFTGTVRDHAEGRTGVTRLEYEAYDDHVVPVLDEVVATAHRRWPDLGRLAVWHRTGTLVVTDVAIVVAVSAPHRDEAFHAARWVLDEVKATAPIWKCEHHDGGASWGRCDHRDGHGDLGDPWGRREVVNQ